MLLNNMREFLLIIVVLYSVILASVFADVSSLDDIRNFPSTTASSTAENSNSFSILTKEFLNKPDAEDGKRKIGKPQNNIRNLAPYPVVRTNGLVANALAETDDSDERQAYYYDKPKIPFETEDRESTNIITNTVPPKREPLEDFDGYHYPKPAIPFPPPTSTIDPDVENLSGGPARLTG